MHEKHERLGEPGMELGSLLSEVKNMSWENLLLLVVGFAIAKLPSYFLQKDKDAIKARDDLIKVMQDQIKDLQSEIKELKSELDELRDRANGGPEG